jgi:hypothetical protein
LYCFVNVFCDKENKGYFGPETNAEQRSNTNIPVKPYTRSVSNVYAKFKLGSGSKLKRLVKQSEWQIIDRQAIILWVKVSVFYGFRLSICLLFPLAFGGQKVTP